MTSSQHRRVSLKIKIKKQATSALIPRRPSHSRSSFSLSIINPWSHCIKKETQAIRFPARVMVSQSYTANASPSSSAGLLTHRAFLYVHSFIKIGTHCFTRIPASRRGSAATSSFPCAVSLFRFQAPWLTSDSAPCALASPPLLVSTRHHPWFVPCYLSLIWWWILLLQTYRSLEPTDSQWGQQCALPGPILTHVKRMHDLKGCEHRHKRRLSLQHLGVQQVLRWPGKNRGHADKWMEPRLLDQPQGAGPPEPHAYLVGVKANQEGDVPRIRDWRQRPVLKGVV